jgi:hypothetical protein
MAAFDFSAAQATASMAEGQHASVPTQSLLMQINADAVCLVRTQFQQVKTAEARSEEETPHRRWSSDRRRELFPGRSFQNIFNPFLALQQLDVASDQHVAGNDATARYLVTIGCRQRHA